VKSTNPKLNRIMKTAMYNGEESRIEPVNESRSEYFLDKFNSSNRSRGLREEAS